MKARIPCDVHGDDSGETERNTDTVPLDVGGRGLFVFTEISSRDTILEKTSPKPFQFITVM